MKYLGHIVSEQGVATDPEKVEAITQWPASTNLMELRAFLGKVGYYRHYVPHFAKIVRPLTRLTQKDTKWVWGPGAQGALDGLMD